MRRPDKEAASDRMKPENIVDYIGRFPKALVAYLEYLVFTMKSQVCEDCFSGSFSLMKIELLQLPTQCHVLSRYEKSQVNDLLQAKVQAFQENFDC